MSAEQILELSEFGSIPPGPSPLYYRIVMLMKDRIVERKPAPGTRLPTEKQLAEQFGVSTITIRAALKELASLGMIERVQGRGTFIRQSESARPEWALGSIEDLIATSRVSESHVVRHGYRKPPGWALPLLGPLPDHGAFNLEIVRSQTGTPFLVTDAYYPPETGDRMARSDVARELGSGQLIIELVERVTGQRVTEIRQSMVAISAPAEPARLLRVRPRTPLLVMTRISSTADGRTVQVARSYYRTEGFAYSIHLKRS